MPLKLCRAQLIGWVFELGQVVVDHGDAGGVGGVFEVFVELGGFVSASAFHGINLRQREERAYCQASMRRSRSTVTCLALRAEMPR